MSYDSEGTTKVLYEPKANYEIDRIEAMIDQNNRFISKVQMNYLIRDNPKVSSDMVFRHARLNSFRVFNDVSLHSCKFFMFFFLSTCE
jgi:hypothetical protein